MNDTKISKIKNGLSIVHTYKPEIDFVSLFLLSKAGSNYEKDDEIGAAHFLEHVTLDRTKKYPGKGELSLLIENTGGYAGAATNREVIKHFVKVISKEREKSFEYLSEVAINPLLAEEEIEREKEVVIQEIQRAKQNYQRVAYENAMAKLYAGSRMAVSNLGDEASVKDLNRETLLNFQERQFQANNLVLSVVGKISLEEAIKFAEKYFSKLSSGEKVNVREVISDNNSASLIVDNKENATQSHLVILYPITESLKGNKIYILECLRHLLSTGKNARLFRTVREKYGLAYVITNSFGLWSLGGEFVIYTAVGEENLNKVIEVIAEELKEILRNGITDEEFNQAKNKALSQTSFRLEDSMNMASNNAWQLLIKDENNLGYGAELEKYIEITKDSLESLMREILKNPPKVSVITKTAKISDIDISPLVI